MTVRRGGLGPDPPPISQCLISWACQQQGRLGNVVLFGLLAKAPEALCSDLGRGTAQWDGCLGDAACSPTFLLQSGAMGGKPLSTFYTQLVLMPQVLHYAQYVLLGLGGLLLLVPIICQLRSQVSRRGGHASDSARVSADLCFLQLALVLPPLSHPAVTFLYKSWKAQDPPRSGLG
jgi:hypothetical protein